VKEKVFVSAVVYTRNEQAVAGERIKLLDDVLYRTFEHYEIIVVNDGSTDGTLERLKDTSRDLHESLIVINLSREHGLEKAMMAGLIKSMGDFVIEIDSILMDFELNRIPEMYQTALKGFDIVVLAPESNPSFTSGMFYKVINKVTYLNLDLKTETARLVSRRALNAMLNLKEKVRYRKALYAYTGYLKTELLYNSAERKFLAKKKINRENISTAFDIIVSFSNFGLKSSHYLSFIFLCFSLFMGAYAMYNYFFNQSVVAGWTTLMILISLGFAGMFFIIGMLGEYISRIMIEIQDRPFYTVRSVEILRPVNSEISELTQSLSEVAAGKQND
jgi:Glycosyltransferases involved in cell wall biogenesis